MYVCSSFEKSSLERFIKPPNNGIRSSSWLLVMSDDSIDHKNWNFALKLMVVLWKISIKLWRHKLLLTSTHTSINHTIKTAYFQKCLTTAAEIHRFEIVFTSNSKLASVWFWNFLSFWSALVTFLRQHYSSEKKDKYSIAVYTLHSRSIK